MLFMLAQTLVAAAQVAATVSVPPPTVVPRFSPTSITETTAPERRIPIGIVVRSPEGVLWSGSLTVGGRGSSSWTQSRSEPADPACAVRGVYGSDERDGLDLQLYLAAARDDPAVRLNVTARWSRNADTPCGGSRTVELRQVATLPDRAPVVIRGDGGLVVELRRR